MDMPPLDPATGGRGDRGNHGRLLSSRACLESAAPDGLEPPAAGASCQRAQRRGDRSLGGEGLATAKKNARRRNAWICFKDEAGFSLVPSVRSTWAPKGKTPVLRHHFNWKRLSMSTVVGYGPDKSDAWLVFQMLAGSYNEESLIEFLTELHGHLNGDKVTINLGRLAFAPQRCDEGLRRHRSAPGSSSSGFPATPMTSTRSR